MANSLLNKFDSNGSLLGVPVSPADGTMNDDISVQGLSRLHNQYSNIGDPNLTAPAYNNMGAAAMGYSNPNPSSLGQRTQLYQEPSSRYKQNAPENRSF
jgi:hypothetical protein|tara:strand:+ start:1188 stop:1484 length:297 start_codon:yes stop_codon:yes gene_type:complete